MDRPKGGVLKQIHQVTLLSKFLVQSLNPNKQRVVTIFNKKDSSYYRFIGPTSASAIKIDIRDTILTKFQLSNMPLHKVTCVTKYDSETILTGLQSGLILVQKLNDNRNSTCSEEDFIENKLAGHNFSIKSIKYCVEQRIIASMDLSGCVILWNSDFSFSRTIEVGQEIESSSYLTDTKSSHLKQLIEILPTTGEIVICKEIFNPQRQEIDLQFKIYSINGSLEAVRILENLQLKSLAVSNLEEGKHVNLIYAGIFQNSMSAILLLSSWDLRTIRIINTQITPNFIYFQKEFLLIADHKQINILAHKKVIDADDWSKSENLFYQKHIEIGKQVVDMFVKKLEVLPFWLVNPDMSSNLMKVDCF